METIEEDWEAQEWDLLWKRDEKNVSKHQFCGCDKNSICMCFWEKQRRIKSKLKIIFKKHLHNHTK